MKYALILMFALFALIIPPLYGTFWDVDMIYSGGFAAGDISLAVNQGNIPSVSYTVNGSLYLTTKSLTGWDWEPVAQAGYWGGWSSLAFNTQGLPCIAYIDGSGSTNYLKYAYKVSGSWFNETVDDVGWLPDYVALDFNASGQACIAYCKTTGTYPDTYSYVVFARRTGTNAWVKQNIAQVGPITGPSLVIDAAGYAYVVFTDSATGKLQVASQSGTGGWVIETVDGSTSSPCVWYSSLYLDSTGHLSVTYFKNDAGVMRLRFASKSSGWKIESCASLAAGTGYYCSHAVTSEGIPLIAYYDTATENLWHAWKSGGVWYTQAVDASPQTGTRPSMALDTIGNVHVSYFDNRNANVKIASALVPVSVSKAKTISGGTFVQISGAVASVAGGEMGSRVYVQEPDRSNGIQLYFPTAVLPVMRGMVLDIQGQMTTVDGECTVNDPDLVEITTVSSPRPLGMTNITLGVGSGLANTGLLVRTYGRVKSKGTDYFVIDDGSGAMLKCTAPGISLPSLNSFVTVTGVSSCETGAVRLLRVRNAQDIVTLP